MDSMARLNQYGNKILEQKVGVLLLRVIDISNIRLHQENVTGVFSARFTVANVQQVIKSRDQPALQSSAIDARGSGVVNFLYYRHISRKVVLYNSDTLHHRRGEKHEEDI